MSKKIVNIFAVILVVFIIYSLISQIITTARSGDRLKQALNKLHSLEQKNQQLKQQLAIVQTPEFLESQARSKLGLAYPGETMIIIPDSKLDQVLGATKPVLAPRLPNYQGWLKLFWK